MPLRTGQKGIRRDGGGWRTLQRVACGLLLAWLYTGGTAVGAEEAGKPLAVNPQNPHYYIFNGKPTVLITSAEHYGAVVNKEFDYVRLSGQLASSYGLNYTRIYPGFLLSRLGNLERGTRWGLNSRAWSFRGGAATCPATRCPATNLISTAGTRSTFRRLKDFVAKAGERGVVVEICFFNAQYSDTWPISPLYYENNIQGMGEYDFQDAQTLRHADLVQREADYVRQDHARSECLQQRGSGNL